MSLRSQPQKSWHRHSLKATIANLQMPVEDGLAELTQVIADEVEQLELGPDVLPDIPGEPFPDTWLMDSAALRDSGRCGGIELWKRNDMAQCADSAGDGKSHVLAMLRSTLMFGA